MSHKSQRNTSTTHQSGSRSTNLAAIQAVQDAGKHSEVSDARATPGYCAKPRRHWAERLLGASSPAADLNSAAARERRSTESYMVVASRLDVDRGFHPTRSFRMLDPVPSDPTEMMGRAGVDISFWRSLTFLATAIAWPSLSTPNP